jgi:hypothetical protein
MCVNRDRLCISNRRLLAALVACVFAPAYSAARPESATLALNAKDTGYRGIWYMNQPLKNEYRFKYSGGLGTYCAKHRPFAVYCAKVNKTFFCYGGTSVDAHREHDLASPGDRQSVSGTLLHMVSYYDHATGRVPRPTILLDKQTRDAHDNPVIAVDDSGIIWIFSTSHGTSRPSYIHRSKRPYDIDEFERVHATKIEGGQRVPMTNFSYMQPWHLPGRGFVAFFTRYNYPAKRTPCLMTSDDGEHWSAWQRLAAIDEGHYLISTADKTKAGAAMNYHPKGKGLNWRTNLYYIETSDFGKSWHGVDGASLSLPLTEPKNAALVYGYEKDGLLVYLKDIRFDKAGHPVILYITSQGYKAGPENDPRTWTTARWTGTTWEIRPVTTSDNNYDMGSLYIEADGTWRIIAPTATGPQPYNPGGEIVMWTSQNRGATWRRIAQLTRGSPFNHTYARQPQNAHDDFYALWADGHGREPSESSIYFCNKAGRVFRLPRQMSAESMRPKRLND